MTFPDDEIEIRVHYPVNVPIISYLSEHIILL